MGLGRAERDSNVIKDNSDNSVTIRLAQNSDDFELLTPLSRSLHAEGRYRNYPYNLERRNALFAKVIEQPDRNALFIAEKREKAIGFLFCSIGPYMVGDHLIATVTSYYVSPSVRRGLSGGEAALRLFKGFAAWALKRNAVELQVHAATGIDPDRTDKFLKRMGFQEFGRSYAIRPLEPNGKAGEAKR